MDRAVNWGNAFLYSIWLWCLINRVLMHWSWMRVLGHGIAILYTAVAVVIMTMTTSAVFLYHVLQGCEFEETAHRLRNSHVMDQNLYWFLMPVLMTLAGFWGCGLIILVASAIVIFTTHMTLRVAGTITAG